MLWYRYCAWLVILVGFVCGFRFVVLLFIVRLYVKSLCWVCVNSIVMRFFAYYMFAW